ncbi:hypothetical protein MAR_035815, partial [Mya arenaria]
MFHIGYMKPASLLMLRNIKLEKMVTVRTDISRGGHNGRFLTACSHGLSGMNLKQRKRKMTSPTKSLQWRSHGALP